MLAIITNRLEPESGTGPRITSQPHFFDHPIRSCNVALSGYELAYIGDDHNVQTISVAVSCAIRDTEIGRGVVVEVSLLLRDDNGDDAFRGWVDYTLFVDLSDRMLPPDIVNTDTGVLR